MLKYYLLCSPPMKIENLFSVHHRGVSRAHHHNRIQPSVSLNTQTTHKQSIPQRPEPAVALLSLTICIFNSDGQSPSQSSLLLSSGFGKIGASQLYFLEPNAAYYRYELKCPLSLIRWTVRGDTNSHFGNYGVDPKAE